MKKLALSKGCLNVGEVVIAGKDHVPLPEDVLAYFTSLRKAR